MFYFLGVLKQSVDRSVLSEVPPCRGWFVSWDPHHGDDTGFCDDALHPQVP